VIRIDKQSIIKNKEVYNKWTQIPTEPELLRAIGEIKKRNIDVILVENKGEALEKIKQLIPAKVSVMTGSSTTLYEIGFMDYYLSGQNPWICLGPQVYGEKDFQKQLDLRRTAETADYFIASVNAISASGQLVATDASGSRVSAYPFAAKNLILVAGIQKITPNLEDAMKRIREYVYPLENERAIKAYGSPSAIGKWVIIEKEIIPHRIKLILVREKLGF